MGYSSRIDSLEETIAEKDVELKALRQEKNQLSEENRNRRNRIAALEKEKFNPETRPDVFKEVEIIKKLEETMKVTKIRPPPILNKVCHDLVEPAYHNHGIVLKSFKVDYKENIILGIDDIKTPLMTDDICTDCGKAIYFDITGAFRYHRGVISTLGGIPRGFGYFHTRCVNSLKYIPMTLSRISVNES